MTGGGAYKFNSLFRETLKVDIEKINEFDSLVWGL